MESKVVAEICLYGIQQKGFGWIANGRTAGLLGDGELQPTTCTTAMWEACFALTDAGEDASGSAWVYMPGGSARAIVNLTSPVTFGNLQWQAAPILEIAAADIEAAAMAG